MRANERIMSNSNKLRNSSKLSIAWTMSEKSRSSVSRAKSSIDSKLNSIRRSIGFETKAGKSRMN